LPVVGRRIGVIAERFYAHMFGDHPELLGGSSKVGTRLEANSSGRWPVRSPPSPALCSPLPSDRQKKVAPEDIQYEVFGPDLWQADPD
jgi:hypothetical protein